MSSFLFLPSCVHIAGENCCSIQSVECVCVCLLSQFKIWLKIKAGRSNRVYLNLMNFTGFSSQLFYNVRSYCYIVLWVLWDMQETSHVCNVASSIDNTTAIERLVVQELVSRVLKAVEVLDKCIVYMHLFWVTIIKLFNLADDIWNCAVFLHWVT